ncbi:unnamed protein product [Acanthosepion pharaonis]|uniref:Uncharacterized protein n=1 Tax=Acanthosepion pharaonis TaxID=158019 RepID=A0A812D9S3_ACAPH|nr:unnamed protein product [Sepia pharaonis]
MAASLGVSSRLGSIDNQLVCEKVFQLTTHSIIGRDSPEMGLSGWFIQGCVCPCPTCLVLFLYIFLFPSLPLLSPPLSLSPFPFHSLSLSLSLSLVWNNELYSGCDYARNCSLSLYHIAFFPPSLFLSLFLYLSLSLSLSLSIYLSIYFSYTVFFFLFLYAGVCRSFILGRVHNDVFENVFNSPHLSL